MDATELDQAVLRRILFAAVYLPTDCPNYLEIICKFAVLDSASECNISSQQVKLVIENQQALNDKAFCTDKALSL